MAALPVMTPVRSCFKFNEAVIASPEVEKLIHVAPSASRLPVYASLTLVKTRDVVLVEHTVVIRLCNVKGEVPDEGTQVCAEIVHGRHLKFPAEVDIEFMLRNIAFFPSRSLHDAVHRSFIHEIDLRVVLQSQNKVIRAIDSLAVLKNVLDLRQKLQSLGLSC